MREIRHSYAIVRVQVESESLRCYDVVVGIMISKYRSSESTPSRVCDLLLLLTYLARSYLRLLPSRS